MGGEPGQRADKGRDRHNRGAIDENHGALPCRGATEDARGFTILASAGMLKRTATVGGFLTSLIKGKALFIPRYRRSSGSNCRQELRLGTNASARRIDVRNPLMPPALTRDGGARNLGRSPARPSRTGRRSSRSPS